ncbi:MAG: alpha/beta fold hydrolase [Actinomycetota bacterium]|nr:alpha/beta fold hydrolase [Actinomycetota bacterium]
MSRCKFVWAHALNSSMAAEDDLGLFDWSPCADVARVVRYDARGHGACPAVQYEDRAYRWSALVDDMLWAVPEGPIVAGGASMGAVTALYAAARAPRRVQALVLATPPAAWEARAPQSEFYRSGAQLVEARGVPELVSALRARPQPRIFAEELPEAREVSLRHLEKMDERVLPAILRGAAGSDLPSRDEVRAIVVPTLILAWEGDPTHPVSTAEALHELIVLSELHVAQDLAGIRAWPYIVRDFLDGLCTWE